MHKVSERFKLYSPDRAILLVNGLKLLGNGHRFTGEERLVTFEVGAVALDDAAIGRDNVTILDNGNVAGDDLLDGNDLDVGRAVTRVTEDSGLGCADRFEGSDSLRGSALTFQV